MSCSTNCLDLMAAKLSDFPKEWRMQLARLFCALQDDLPSPDCSDCESVTSFTGFTTVNNQLCLSFKDENGVTTKRCVDLSVVFNQILNNVDPGCVSDAGDWGVLSFAEKFQLLVDSQCACCEPTTTTTSTTTTSSTTTTTTAAPTSMTVYWGWKDDRTVLTPSQIVAQAQGIATLTPGDFIAADYTANNQPKYLWMAEPVTEPLKTAWDGDGASSLNQGIIGGAVGDNLFPDPDITGSFRLYITGYLTQNTTHTIEFQY